MANRVDIIARELEWHWYSDHQCGECPGTEFYSESDFNTHLAERIDAKLREAGL